MKNRIWVNENRDFSASQNEVFVHKLCNYVLLNYRYSGDNLTDFWIFKVSKFESREIINVNENL